MSLLTSIDGIPLFSTSAEAASWPQSNGVTGAHTHAFQGHTGYMGGASHQAAVSAINTNTGTTASSTASGSGGY